METAEYEVMYDAEDRHWWYVGLRDLIVPSVLERLRGNEGAALLDAGCGTGRTLACFDDARAFGIELSSEAFRFLSRRGLDRVAKGTVARLPFADSQFDVVVSADVICCLGAPDDLEALREFARVLRPGGALLLNLPACPWLKGRHDEAVHTKRRYTRSGLLGLLREAGLVPEFCSYRNTLLFPPAVLVRLAQRLNKSRGPVRSDVRTPSPTVNRLLAAPLRAENRWLRAGLRLPFGLSVYAVARRERHGEGRP